MRINEVSKQLDISCDTLRYYEKIGLIGPIKKTSGGIREYQQVDINTIKFIKCMRSAGLSIEFLIEYMTLIKKGDETKNERKELLIKQREILKQKINDMSIALERLNYKIDLYYEGKLEEYFKLTGEREE